MRLPTILSLAIVLALGAARAAAQSSPSPTPRPTPPAPPFVNEAPGFSAWTIARYNVAGSGGQPADVVVRSAAAASKPDIVTTVIKTVPVRHQQRKIKTGEQEDIWFERGNRITMQSMWKIPVFEGNTSSAKQPQGPDFPELSWISAANFTGIQEHEGASYFVFETQATSGDATQAKEYGYKLAASFNRAFINADTRLPWLHQTGDVLQRYLFQAAPTAQLEVPPEFQAMFDAYEKRKTAASRKPVAP